MEKSRKIKRKKTKHYILGGLTWALVGSMVGTMGTISYFTKNDSKVSSKSSVNVECQVPCKHLHCYINSEGYVTYLESEEATIDDFVKQDNFKVAFLDSDFELASKLYQNRLVLVEDNRKYIEAVENTVGLKEYVVGYDENNNPITGVAGFYAYDYDSESDTFIKSGYVSSIFNISEDYPYIKIGNLFDIVDIEELDNELPGFAEDDFYDEDEDIVEDFENWLQSKENKNPRVYLSNKQKKIGPKKL